MLDLSNLIEEYHKKNRSSGDLNYFQVIQNNLPELVDGALSFPNDFDLTPHALKTFAEALMYYYHSNSGFKCSSWSIREHGPDESGTRTRTLRINTEPFCAGVTVPLPSRNKHTQIVDWYPISTFEARLRTGLLIFDHVVMIDPCPKIFEWSDHPSYIYTEAVGIEGDANHLRYKERKPLDYDRPLPSEIEQVKLNELRQWFEICSRYKSFFESGQLFVVPNRFPDWLVSYSSGSDSDKPKFGDFKTILKSKILPLSDPMFIKFHEQEWNEVNSWDLLERIFWQNHFIGNGSVAIESLAEVEWLIAQLNNVNTPSTSNTQATHSVASHIFNLKYGLSLTGIETHELQSISSSDEIVSELRTIIREVGTLALLNSESMRENIPILTEKFISYEDKLETLSSNSNFYSGIFRPSKDACVAAIGSSAATYMTAAEANAIMWAGLGAAFPLSVMLPFYISRTVSKNKVSANAKTLLTCLNSD